MREDEEQRFFRCCLSGHLFGFGLILVFWLFCLFFLFSEAITLENNRLLDFCTSVEQNC